jgi:hypothetical protein
VKDERHDVFSFGEKRNYELKAKVQKRISYITQLASRSTGQGISKSLFTMRRFKVPSQKLNHSGKKGKVTSYKGWIATTNFLMATVVR